uniref:Cell surface A33 antigen isoform X2 n=1 Tax=Pogona vitticeps TaxID=103695 RepID=A0ABM5FXG2_9SAUR
MKTNKEPVLFMLSAVVAVVHAVTVQTPQVKVEAARDKNATLQCIFHTSATNRVPGDNVSWRKVPAMEDFAYKVIGSDLEYKGNYGDRMTFSGDLNQGNGSITFSELTMADNGTYECTVQLFEDPPPRSVLIDLLVLVIPSKPTCKIIGKAEYGQNINLTCHSDEGSPKPTYTWQRYDAQNQPQQLVGTPMEESMNIALYAGIIGGVVAAIIIIAVLAYCCCCRSSKDKEYEPTETNDGFQPHHEPVEIRGPSEEEIQEEGEERHSPQMPPTWRPPSRSSEAVA